MEKEKGNLLYRFIINDMLQWGYSAICIYENVIVYEDVDRKDQTYTETFLGDWETFYNKYKRTNLKGYKEAVEKLEVLLK